MPYTNSKSSKAWQSLLKRAKPYFQLFLILVTGCLLFRGTSAFAQSVEKVRGASVLLDLGGTQANPGDEFITIDENGKRTGIIRISQTRGQKAVAKIIKGVVLPGETLTVRGKSKARTNPEPPAEDDSAPPEQVESRPRGKDFIGVMLGYNNDTMSFLAGNSSSPPSYTETANLTGTTTAFKGFYDHPWTPEFDLRFMGSYDGFNGSYTAKSNSINRGSTLNSNLSVSYVGLEGEILWKLYDKKLTNAWLGLGYAFEYILGSSTNLYSLTINSSFLNAIFAGAGGNIAFGNSAYIPIYAHYKYFLASSGVTQNAIEIGAGYGWRF